VLKESSVARAGKKNRQWEKRSRKGSSLNTSLRNEPINERGALPREKEEKTPTAGERRNEPQPPSGEKWKRRGG